MKFVIIAGATLAVVTAAGAATSAPTARLSAGSSRQDADWQDPIWEDHNRQDASTRRRALLIRGMNSGRVESDLYRRRAKRGK
jgi:hypothetical protein